MSDDYERLVLGGGGDSPPSTAGLPAFLMDNEDDVIVKKGAGGTSTNVGLSFLDDISPASLAKNSTGAEAVLDARTGELVRQSAHTISSAEELHIVGESGARWDLYRVRILGKGSFGCATLYEQRSPGAAAPRLVVVKDVNIQTMNNREEEMASLRTEVDVLRRSAGHPNVVRFLDYYEDSREALMAYILLEYCGGGDLGGSIESAQQAGRYLPEAFVIGTLVQVVMALQFLHVTQRILHRDMKPQNVFLLSDDVTVRLGDFGVATVLGGFGEKAKATCGSPFYMAPELCAERAYDGGADVWSTGVTFYELIARERPFNATSLPALTQLVTKGRCVPLADRRELPYSKELKELVQSMLTIDASARPTLRRMLRNSYLQANLHAVPAAVLNTPFYRDTFGDAAVDTALPRCLHAGTATAALCKSGEAAAAEEYEDDFEV